MTETLYNNISHLTVSKLSLCEKVSLIPKGEKYQTIFGEVQPEIAERDRHFSFFGSDLFPTYKAKSDIWSYAGQFFGTPEYIEGCTNKHILFKDNKWYNAPCLTIHFLDSSTQKFYFTTDKELEFYVKTKFEKFLIPSKTRKIKI